MRKSRAMIDAMTAGLGGIDVRQLLYGGFDAS